jgi:hypothetical protein
MEYSVFSRPMMRAAMPARPARARRPLHLLDQVAAALARVTALASAW